jgi:hypothetical protein
VAITWMDTDSEEATRNPISVLPPIRLSRAPSRDRRPIALVKSLPIPRQAKARAGETGFRGRYQLSNSKRPVLLGPGCRALYLHCPTHSFGLSASFAGGGTCERREIHSGERRDAEVSFWHSHVYAALDGAGCGLPTYISLSCYLNSCTCT